MTHWRTRLMWLSLGLVALGLALVGLVYGLTWHPDPVQETPVVCAIDAPVPRDKPLKILSWNVQYMAGKGYVFYYDLLDGSGPDERPSKAAISHTLDEVARVIEDEAPDFVLLQEVDDGAARTDKEDQLARLLSRLSAPWCHTSAFYWKAAFVPHPRILGAAGLKLSTLSRWHIDTATRYQLALIPSSPLSQQFGLKRAVHIARLPLQNGGTLALANTHLDAFAQGTDTMARQVDQVAALLDELDLEQVPWIIGGDFNLLASRAAYDRLAPHQRAYFNPETELSRLTKRFLFVPTPAETSGPDAARWFTHFPNDPAAKGPDRTIDYLGFSKRLLRHDHTVRRRDTLDISDHLPLVATFEVPPR